MTTREVARLFAGAPFPWWIAGGHAIDHAVGRHVRAHGDIDVLVLRVDQIAVRAWLVDWDCHAADPPGRLRPWATGEWLPDTVSDVWCRRSDGDPWQLQLILDGGDRRMWRSRRSTHAQMPIEALAVRDADGTPYLTPEVQLFYKAKAPRAKDMEDFAAALPHLTPAQGEWLKRAVAGAYGKALDWTVAADGTARFALTDQGC